MQFVKIHLFGHTMQMDSFGGFHLAFLTTVILMSMVVLPSKEMTTRPSGQNKCEQALQQDSVNDLCPIHHIIASMS